MKAGAHHILLIIIYLLSFPLLGAERYAVEGETKETGIYSLDKKSFYTILNMGYASAQIQNPETWSNKNKSIYEIDIVFTAYPKHKEDWITNYDLLLNKRIKELQNIEQSLINNKNIKWNFILQTSCQNEEEAKRMFHGVVIKYKNLNPAPKSYTKLSPQNEAIETIYNEIETTVYGLSGMQDSVVYKTFARNNWSKMLIVNDWTGSMYPYGAQAVLWHRLNFEKQGVKYFIFFNDGNHKLDRQKRIGNTGGIYYCKPDSIEYLMKVMKIVAKRGDGGDIPENNIEALLKGIRLIKGFDELVMIADNNAGVRDMTLLPRVNKPVRIILCGTGNGIPIHPNYLEIARSTGGSIHTIESDITGLEKLKEGERINICGIDYTVKKGKMTQVKKN